MLLQCTDDNPADPMNSGIAVSDMFWPGIWVEVPEGEVMNVTEIGVKFTPNGTQSGHIFGAIVQVAASGELPEPSDLSGNNIIATTTIAANISDGQAVISAPIAATLDSGWYALVLGTDAFGATLSETGSVWGQDTPSCDNETQPFLLFPQSGGGNLMSGGNHIYIEGTNGVPQTSDVSTCLSILREDPDAPTGIYIIDPDRTGGLPPFDAKCVMDTEG